MANIKKIVINKKAMGLRPFIISLIAVILFSFFIFSFIGGFLQTTNPNTEVLSNTYGLNDSINDMSDSLDGFRSLSDRINEDFQRSQPSATDYVFLIFQGAFEIPKTIFSASVGTINLITTTLFPSFAGTGFGTLLNLAFTIIGAGLIITAVLLAIKLVRSGESER